MKPEIKTILQALIDGEEIEFSRGRIWSKASLPTTLNALAQWSCDNTAVSLRTKPKTIQIGEFTVPEPLRSASRGSVLVSRSYISPICLSDGVAKYSIRP